MDGKRQEWIPGCRAKPLPQKALLAETLAGGREGGVLVGGAGRAEGGAALQPARPQAGAHLALAVQPRAVHCQPDIKTAFNGL